MSQSKTRQGARVGDLTTSDNVQDLMAGKSVIARQWHWCLTCSDAFPLSGHGSRTQEKHLPRLNDSLCSRSSTVSTDHCNNQLQCNVAHNWLWLPSHKLFRFTHCPSNHLKWWSPPLHQLANFLSTYRVRRLYDVTIAPKCALIVFMLSCLPWPLHLQQCVQRGTLTHLPCCTICWPIPHC